MTMNAGLSRGTLGLLTLALLCAGVVLSCAQVRKATYPPDFVYLEQKQLISEMALLAFYMRQLDEIMLDDSSISSEQQRNIISIMAKIDAGTDRLGAGSAMTNHLVLDDHLDQFKVQVQVAMQNASADPPNYFALGRLSGACLGCHKYRDY